MHSITSRRILMLKPSEIVSPFNQPRKHFDEKELKSLADSISVVGVIEPLTVRKNEEGNYELISGERRLRAARLAGLRRVPCLLHKVDTATAILYSMIENTKLSRLNAFEEALGIEMLINRCRLSESEIAARLGVPRQAVVGKLRLLRLSVPIQVGITAAGLSEQHAFALLRLPAEQREKVLELIIKDDLSAMKTDSLVDEILNPKPQIKEEKSEMPPIEEEPVRKMSIGDTRIFANSLYKLVETMQNSGVFVQTKKTENEKHIEYKIRIDKQSLKTGCRQLKIC